jgi:hypothetical protein
MTELSLQQKIAYLKTAEAKIYEALATGGATVSEWEIRGRIVKFRDLHDELRKIEDEIAVLEGKPSRSRPVRSKVNLRY